MPDKDPIESLADYLDGLLFIDGRQDWRPDKTDTAQECIRDQSLSDYEELLKVLNKRLGDANRAASNAATMISRVRKLAGEHG